VPVFSPLLNLREPLFDSQIPHVESGQNFRGGGKYKSQVRGPNEHYEYSQETLGWGWFIVNGMGEDVSGCEGGRSRGVVMVGGERHKYPQSDTAWTSPYPTDRSEKVTKYIEAMYREAMGT